jgi:hypothetical protein
MMFSLNQSVAPGAVQGIWVVAAAFQERLAARPALTRNNSINICF